MQPPALRSLPSFSHPSCDLLQGKNLSSKAAYAKDLINYRLRQACVRGAGIHCPSCGETLREAWESDPEAMPAAQLAKVVKKFAETIVFCPCLAHMKHYECIEESAASVGILWRACTMRLVTLMFRHFHGLALYFLCHRRV